MNWWIIGLVLCIAAPIVFLVISKGGSRELKKEDKCKKK